MHYRSIVSSRITILSGFRNTWINAQVRLLMYIDMYFDASYFVLILALFSGMDFADLAVARLYSKTVTLKVSIY